MKKILFLFILSTGLFVACEDPGTDILYDKTFLELDAATTVTGARTYSYLRQDDGQGVPSGFEVTLASAHLPNPVNFTFAIDTDASTAIEGLHYRIDGNTGTIPANASTATLPITILDDNIQPGEMLSIVVDLVSADVAINPNYETATHMIQVLCESALAGTYTAVATGTSTDDCCSGEEVTTTSEVTLTDEGGGVYTISDFSGGLYLEWYDVYGITADTDLSTKIEDVCNAISIPTFTEFYGQPTSGSGSVDPATGIITYTWSSGWGDEATVVLTPN